MEKYLEEIFTQWDRQEASRISREASDQAYIELNNLYLSIQKGVTKLTIHTGNQLRTLAGKAYSLGDPMLDWWKEQFLRLDGWNDV